MAGALLSKTTTCADSSPDLGELPAGTLIGDFQIESLLGRGGMSRVYRARQRSLDRTVALKVTRVVGDDACGDEGRTMAAIVHDHIVPVYSQETIGSWRLLAMGFVDGPTLAEVLANSQDAKTTPTAFACRTIRDLARALAHAHRLGILHCDIKPANILFTSEGRALLTDFNVSVRRGPDGESSQSVGGTLSYMAPEHLALLTGGGSATVDERADLYSLGLVFFQLLTGDWPFPESSVTTDPLSAPTQLQAIRLSSHARFPTCGPRLSPGLRSIVEKCLTPQPADRYRTADGLAEDLDRYLAHRPLRFAADPSLRERTAKWVRRHPAWTVATVAGVLIGVMAMRAEKTLTTARPANTTAPASAAEARDAAEWDRRGLEWMTQNRFEDALRCFDQAVTLNPQLVPAQHNRGVARFRLGQFAGACESFDQAVRLGNASGLLFSHRAAARFALGDVAGAEADFARAREAASTAELGEVLANASEFKARRAAPP
jgi:hypothetical protein